MPTVSGGSQKRLLDPESGHPSCRHPPPIAQARIERVAQAVAEQVEPQGEITVLKEVAGDGTDTLIIDDLVDPGRTAKLVREMLPKAHFATVYAKPAGRPMVDTFLTEVSQDTWIHFPWDLALTFVRPIAAED